MYVCVPVCAYIYIYHMAYSGLQYHRNWQAKGIKMTQKRKRIVFTPTRRPKHAHTCSELSYRIIKWNASVAKKTLTKQNGTMHMYINIYIYIDININTNINIYIYITRDIVIQSSPGPIQRATIQLCTGEMQTIIQDQPNELKLQNVSKITG